MAELDASRVINGSFGQVYMEGQWLTNFSEMTAEANIEKAKLKLSGDRWARHKLIGLDGTGTMTGFKVTSKLIEFNTPITDNKNKMVKTELISKLSDPEAWGHERVRLKNVMFDKIQLANWKTGAEVNEDWPFTFEEYELLDPIVED